MYVYEPRSPSLYAVGFYTPNGDWKHESFQPTAEIAAKRVNYLNGGRDPDVLQKVDER